MLGDVRQSLFSELSATDDRQEAVMQPSPVPTKRQGAAVEDRRNPQQAGPSLQLVLDAIAPEMCAARRKSAEILTRSLGVWNAALCGFVCITMEDGFSAVRARLSCSSLASLADLELELTVRAISDVTARLCLLLTIALQIAEETAYPVQRLVGLELEKLTPAVAA
jgi:hypothetical protein